MLVIIISLEQQNCCLTDLEELSFFWNIDLHFANMMIYGVVIFLVIL